MFILDKNTYLLKENIKQAKSFLKKEYNIDVDQDNSVIFEAIRELLKKFPNLVYVFTKLIFQEENKERALEKAREIIEWYKENKNISKQLPKNLIQYDSLEKISDDIVQLEDQIKIKKFYKSLYSSMRSEVDRLGEEGMEKFNQLALSFMDLKEDYKKLFTPLKYFEKNDISISEFLDTLDKFINKSDVNERKKEVLEYVKKHDINIVYNQNNILAIETSDKEHVCNLGSEKWCIVYSDNYYDSYLDKSKYNTQYFIFNFNLPASNPNSEFGITIDPKGKTLHGGSQNKNNNAVDLNRIYDMTDIPKGSLKSKYEEIYNKINSGTLDMIEFAKNNGIAKTIEKLNEPMKIGDIEVNIPKESLKYFQEDNQDSKVLFNSLFYYNDLIGLLKGLKELENATDAALFFNALGFESKGKSLKSIFNTYEIISAHKVTEEIGVEFLELVLSYFYFSSNLEQRILEYLTGNNGGYLILIDFVTKSGVVDSPRQEIYVSSYNMLSKRNFEAFYDILEKGNSKLYEVYEKSVVSLEFREDMKLLTSEQYEKMLNIEQVANSRELPKFLSMLIKTEEAVKLFDKDMFYLIASKELTKPLAEYLSNKEDLTEINRIIKQINKLDKEVYPYIRDVSNEFKIDRKVITKVITDLKAISETEELLNYVISNEYIFSWLVLDLSMVLQAHKKEEYNIKELFTIIVILKMVKSNASARQLRKLVVEDNIVNIKDINDFPKIQEQIDDMINNKEVGLNGMKKYFNQSDIYNKMPSKPTVNDFEKEIEMFLGELLELLFDEVKTFETFGDYYSFFNKYDRLIKREYLMVNDDEEDQLDYISDNLHRVLTTWAGEKDEVILSKYNKNNIGLDTQIVKYLNETSMDTLCDKLYYEDHTEDLDVVKLIGYSIANNEELLEKYLEEGNSFALLSLAYHDTKYNKVFYENIGMSYDKEEEAWVYETTLSDLEDLYDSSGMNFSLENYYDMFDAWHNDFNYFEESGIFDEITVHNLRDIISIIKSDGLDINTSAIDKYTESSYSYKKSQELYSEDAELRQLRNDIESVLKEDYETEDEDFYDDFEADQIIDAINGAYSQTEADAQGSKWFDNTINELDKILKYFKNNSLIKYTNGGIEVIPDIWEMCDNEYFLSNLRDYSGLEEFEVSNMFNAYTEAEGKFSPDSGDNNYVSFDDNDYEDYNERLNDRLYEFIPREANESVVLKYSDFIKEELDQRFISEFEDGDRAEEEWEYYNNMIKTLNKKGGEVYRLVFLDNISDLDDKELGEHWCLEFDQLSNFYDSLEETEGELPYIIKGYLKPNQIDTNKSIETFKQLPHELEVNLKGEPFKFEVGAYRGTPKADSIWGNRI